MAAEGFPTLDAEERFLARVDPLVLSEAGAPGEGLATLAALVGFLTRMPAPVQSEGCALVEGFPTLPTHKKTLPGACTLLRAPWRVFSVSAGLAGVPGCARHLVLRSCLSGLDILHMSIRRVGFCGNTWLGQEGAPGGSILLKCLVSLLVAVRRCICTAGGRLLPEHSLASGWSSSWALPGRPTAWSTAVEPGPDQLPGAQPLSQLFLANAPLLRQLLLQPQPGLPVCKR